MTFLDLNLMILICTPLEKTMLVSAGLCWFSKQGSLATSFWLQSFLFVQNYIVESASHMKCQSVCAQTAMIKLEYFLFTCWFASI